jgi:hypothetical protein
MPASLLICSMPLRLLAVRSLPAPDGLVVGLTLMVVGDGKVTSTEETDVDLDRPDHGLYERFHAQVGMLVSLLAPVP